MEQVKSWKGLPSKRSTVPGAPQKAPTSPAEARSSLAAAIRSNVED